MVFIRTKSVLTLIALRERRTTGILCMLSASAGDTCSTNSCGYVT